MGGRHGSLSKAGKVRDHTPRMEKTSRRRSKIPRVANRRKFEKRELLRRPSGQSNL
jgi:ribosomal protein S30